MSTEPVLRIVRGAPTAEEVAAVTALVTAAASAASADPALPPRGRWADPAYRLRRPLLTGPGAWRAAFD